MGQEIVVENESAGDYRQQTTDFQQRHDTSKNHGLLDSPGANEPHQGHNDDQQKTWRKFDQRTEISDRSQGNRAGSNQPGGHNKEPDAETQCSLVKALLHELRCTWHPDLLSAADLMALSDEIRNAGADRLVIQEHRPAGCGASLPEIVAGDREQAGLDALARPFRVFFVRGAP